MVALNFPKSLKLVSLNDYVLPAIFDACHCTLLVVENSDLEVAKPRKKRPKSENISPEHADLDSEVSLVTGKPKRTRKTKAAAPLETGEEHEVMHSPELTEDQIRP